MKNLKTCFLLAVVILIISFGNEADSKPLRFRQPRLIASRQKAVEKEMMPNYAKQRDSLGYPEELPKEVAPEKREKADERKSEEASDFQGYPEEEDAPEKVEKSEADSEAANDERRKNEWMEQKTKEHRDSIDPWGTKKSDLEEYKSALETEIFFLSHFFG